VTDFLLRQLRHGVWYHGIDHRSQIDTILSTHGLETLDLQMWPYAMELGASKEAK